MPIPFRVIVTGSRNWINEDFVWTQLTAVQWKEKRPLTVIHGGCRDGADRFAASWVLFQVSHGGMVRPLVFPADWSKGLSDGFRRNERMVRSGADLILGFLADCTKPGCDRPRPHGSHGTSHCLKVAKAHRIPVRAWRTKGWRNG